MTKKKGTKDRPVRMVTTTEKQEGTKEDLDALKRLLGTDLPEEFEIELHIRDIDVDGLTANIVRVSRIRDKLLVEKPKYTNPPDLVCW